MSDRTLHVKDPFAGLVLHHMRVDWKQPHWERHSLSNLFMGNQHHWVSEEYDWTRRENNGLWVDPDTGQHQPGNQWGPVGSKMTPLEIERQILSELHPREWGGTSRVGKPVYQHMLTLMKLMLPKTDITDTLSDAVMFFCTVVGNGLHILNLIGGQNMSKTAATVRLAFVTMFINPEFTKWTVANPFDNAAEDTVWGEIEIIWEDLIDAHPGGTNTILFPKAVKYQKPLIEFVPNRPKAARIQLQNNKKAGKGKGAKSRKGEDNEDVGIFGEIVDEINEIDSQVFLKTLVNKSSQKNYIAITSQNFKDPEDMGGQITEPSPAWGGPDSFEKLNVDDDLWWHSVHAGMTLRFDGHNSANILAGRVIYSYLFDETDRLRIAESGVESPIYMSQVRSFPVQGATANALLSKPKLSASRHTDQFFAVRGEITNVGFCDPAFGGRDDAVYGSAYFASCVVTDGSGTEMTQELFVVPEQFVTLKLVREAKFNDFWRERYRRLGLNPADETANALISFEDQIAIQCLEHNRLRGVPAANFGYDFSMRPDIVTSMNKIIGFSSLAFSYPHPPSGIPLLNFKGLGKLVNNKEGQVEDSKELCKNRLTELGMFVADLFLSKVFRGGEKCPTAIIQLCRTHLEQVKGQKKYKIEDKAEYKDRWSGTSPDHRDVLMGLGGVAAMRGFRTVLKAANADNQSNGTFSLLKRSGKFRNKVVAKLPANV